MQNSAVPSFIFISFRFPCTPLGLIIYHPLPSFPSDLLPSRPLPMAYTALQIIPSLPSFSLLSLVISFLISPFYLFPPFLTPFYLALSFLLTPFHSTTLTRLPLPPLPSYPLPLLKLFPWCRQHCRTIPSLPFLLFLSFSFHYSPTIIPFLHSLSIPSFPSFPFHSIPFLSVPLLLSFLLNPFPSLP